MTVPKMLYQLIDGAAQGVHFPATLIYEEGWLLRVALEMSRSLKTSLVEPNSASQRRRWPFVFKDDDWWYSEARLDSPFPRVSRKNRNEKPEGSTHADAVVRNGAIGSRRDGHKARLDAKNTTRLDVFEAKLGSSLSAGTRYVPDYNQAARNVACILWATFEAELEPEAIKLGFWVVAPEVQRTAFARDQDDNRQKPCFQEALQPSHILAAIEKRAEFWLAALDAVHRAQKKPTMDTWLAKVKAWLDPNCRLDIGFISWEEVGDAIRAADSSLGEAFDAFYSECKSQNRIPQ